MPLFGEKKFGRKKKPAVEAAVEPDASRLPDPPATDEQGRRSVTDHREYLLDQVEPLTPFGHALLDTLGLSSCESIDAHVDLPGFDSATTDGYAVHAADTFGASEDQPVRMAVVGEVSAGSIDGAELAPGSAMRIAAGAPVPAGADAVVTFEATDRGSDDVAIFAGVRAGSNIRRRGEDISAGDRMLEAGESINPRTIAMLAGIGIDALLVRPRPRVVVLATGAELVAPGRPLETAGQVYDSTSFLLAAAAKAEGAQVFRVGQVPADAAALRQTVLDQLLRADLILTTGGSHDDGLVAAVMRELGLTDFASVAMQPGPAQGFALVGEERVPMIMLPGNPVSAFVAFEAFVRPVVRKLMGVEPLLRPEIRAIASRLIRAEAGTRHFIRGVVATDPSGRRTVEPIGGQGVLGELSRCNCLIVMEPERDMVAAGDAVTVWPLTEDQ